MTDERDKVASLDQKRQERQQEAHERGELLAFHEFVFSDQVDTDPAGVTLELSEAIDGVYMTPEDAEALGMALIQAAAIQKGLTSGNLQYIEEGDGVG